MSKLVFDATGKYVHPTRYRQILETAISRQLSSSAKRQHPRTRNMALLLQGSTIRSSDRARWQVKHMNI